MSAERVPLVFATQGGELSYHARAVRSFMGDVPVAFVDCETFGEVILTTRRETNLGAIAICTVAGTVDAAATEIVCQSPASLSRIIGKQEEPVELAFLGPYEQTLEDLRRPKVKCLAQRAAIEQCEPFIAKHLPNLKRGKSQHRRESLRAVHEVFAANDPNLIAIGSNFVAEMLGGFVLGPKQINPKGSKTIFYMLQQELQPDVLPEHSDRTEPRAVVSLAHPEGEGEFEKCMVLADSLGIRISKFIPFDIGDFTRYDRDRRRGGGIFELAHTSSSGEIAEFSARIKKIKDNKGFQGPFSMRNLGGFMYYPEPYIDPYSLIPEDGGVVPPSINLDRVERDLTIDNLKLDEVIALTENKNVTRRILNKAIEMGKKAEQALELYEESE